MAIIKKKEAPKAVTGTAPKEEAPAKKTADDLKAAIAKAEKALDAAKEKHIEAGADLEEARTAFLELRGVEAEEGQVKE